MTVPEREDFLLAKALYVAIQTLSDMPPSRRPESDIAGMREILRHRYGALAWSFVAEDELRAALAELPQDASQDEVCARRDAWMEAWNRRRHQEH